jgi:hypothetical protein
VYKGEFKASEKEWGKYIHGFEANNIYITTLIMAANVRIETKLDNPL